MAPGSFAQEQFGGGIFRGRRAPADSVYDAINALLNDEREMYRRGGSAYKSGSNAIAALVGLWDGQTLGGSRTLFWTSASNKAYVLDSNDSSIVEIYASTDLPAPAAAGVGIGGMVFLRSVNDQQEFTYAGSRKARYTTGTITTTLGSTAVTGVGTSWSANVDQGMFLEGVGIVNKVNSNTSLTLERGASQTLAGAAYSLSPALTLQPVSNYAFPIYHAAAGTRLVRGVGRRAYFSRRLTDSLFYAGGGTGYAPIADSTTDFHELPRGAVIVGADSIEDVAILFTTSGVWAISNLALDLFDDVANIQHQVAQINQDLILWGEPGIAPYQGALLVPAMEDVYMFSLGAPPVPVSQGVRPLYREYVESGYQPGTATVYRGHYVLPVLDGSNNVVDVLVCRLDLADPTGTRRPGWTRQANGAAGRGYATRIGASTRSPQLLGLDGLRVSNLTGCFDPDATRKADADATNHALTIIGNDVRTGPGGRPNTVLSALVTTELVDAATDNPTYAFATAAGAEGSSFTTATVQDTGASTAPESDGAAPTTFSIVRKVDRIRWRFQTSGAAASAILRRVELRIRQSGRQ
jgi:hypothetical protein